MPRGIYERDDLPVREKEGLPQIKTCVYGEIPDEIVIREHDAKMLVSIANGQRTGHFLDQQENRGRLKPYAPGQDAIGRLLDELESLGLDEELEDPGENTVVLMEWGEQMATALAPERLEIHIDRPLDSSDVASAGSDGELTSNGTRTVAFVPVGKRWAAFDLQ